MARSEGFAPIAASDARLLILGSLPGRKSLDDGEYYAHPRNAFWPIMSALFNADGTYACRCDRLRASQVAVWDVLRSSVRPGSLDASIQLESAQCNDFEPFFSQHCGIELIAFNGKKAAQLFRRFVDAPADVQTCDLPSTSPAYASLRLEDKLQQWRAGLAPIIGRTS